MPTGLLLPSTAPASTESTLTVSPSGSVSPRPSPPRPVAVRSTLTENWRPGAAGSSLVTMVSSSATGRRFVVMVTVAVEHSAGAPAPWYTSATGLQTR